MIQAHCARGSIPTRTRLDARTRAEQIQSQERAWKELLPLLVDAFLAWKHGAALSRDSERATTEPPRTNTAPEVGDPEWFTVAAIRDMGTSTYCLTQYSDLFS